MSENKNGQGAQWSKSAVTAAAVTAAAIAAAAQKQHQQHIQHPPIYNARALSLTSPAAGTSSVLYGGTGHLGSHQTTEVSSYAAARFQAPPIDHRSAPPSSSHIVPPSPSSTTNVPVPSGFIPPPFPPAAGGATSVLTPNPYAVATLTAPGATHSGPSPSQSNTLSHPPANHQFSGPHQMPTSHHAHFGIEQFQHLNVQQQYELSKLMAASFSTNHQIMDSSGPTNLSSNTTLISSAQPTSTIVTSSGTSACQTSTAIRQPPTSSSTTEIVSSGNINSQTADQVISAISTGISTTKLATTPIHGRLMGLGVHAPDEEKLQRIQQVVESGIGDHAKQQIVQILDRISTLRPVEKLLLYLRLPGEQPETDPLRQPQNPLGTRSEINHTINWVRTHLEQDHQVSIPKQDVYNDYLVYCDRLDIKPLSTADFGKVMKQVFPGIRPRRLGTRGHSRYCYAAMRKTSKLPAPHLPTLATVKPLKGACEKDGSIDLSTNIIDSTGEQEESWSVVKQWAETMLHVKIDTITDLATHIKSNDSMPLTGGAHTPFTGATRGANSGVTHKKLAQREPKEKRVMVDMGPLKKRRKKKRKGSSSSESSFHQNLNASDQQQIQQQLSPANSSKSGSLHAVLSPAMEDCQKVKIKQEIMDSPGYPPSVGSLSTLSQSTDSANVTQHQTSIAANTLKMTQHQVMPMNLAAETRGGISSVLSRVASTTSSFTTSAFEHVRPSSANTTTTTATAAVKNLTPKIMELSTEKQAISPPTPTQTIIKEEIGMDDYNTSNIFCKKVRKAQQTKGFWANSPTSTRSTSVTAPTTSFPVITTTASTPPPAPASVISTPSNNSDSVVVYNMGPPTQMAPSISPNSQSINDDVNSLGQPKVLSRNLLQLKAKKIMAAAAAAAGCDPPDLSAAKDAADLPANLGLPRERVISICNMDKHELDDYFLPVEEENSEDQETELLQYFQMGDAEEKLTKNSSSDAKRNSNSTVNQLTSVTTSVSKLTTTNLTTTTSTMGVELTSNSITTTPKISSGMMMSTYKCMNNTPSTNDITTNSQVQNGKTQQSYTLDYPKSTTTNSLNKLQMVSSCLTATTSSSCLNTVGTASASLAQLTQKHQQQMQQPPQQQLLQNQQQKNQPQPYSKVSIKRKININTRNTTSEITAARKNYSFLPISPNINAPSSTSNNTLLSMTYSNSNSSGTGFFASPGLSRLLTKQQSLDSDTTSDPMIGATRRLRSYNSMMTSASAPPSPSVLKQQQEQQLFNHMANNILVDQWSHSSGPFNSPSTSANVASSIMGDQNSLDLDLFGEAAAAAASAATSATFSCRNNFNMGINNMSEGIMNSNADSLIAQMSDVTQRSQSVPLSQLQRSQSPTFNRSFHCDINNPAAMSACNSLAETPVPSEFIDSVTMLSENSCSQQSATIKIEEVASVVASDTTAILDEVDVSEILSSPDFVASLNQTCATKTTCSSAGSSSGYSSTGHFSLSSVNYNIGGGGNGGGSGAISSSISRSVPSTPLPHQNPQSLFGNGNNFYRRRFINNCQSLNGGVAGGGVLENLNTFSNSFSTGKYVYGNISSSLSRSACDISKSMPSTPITTTPSSFRYSPSEFTRDFLINGNTIDDSITSSFGAVGSDNLMGSDVVGVDVPLDSESLLNEEDTLINDSRGIRQVESGVLTPDFSVQTETSSPGLGGVVGESSVVIGVGSDLLDNL